MTSTTHIDIGKDFTPYLGTRDRHLGDRSGERFREEILRPAYLASDIVVLNLDAIEGYSASFFEEALGGLVRDYGLKSVMSKVRFYSTRRPFLIPLIEEWMREAGDGRG